MIDLDYSEVTSITSRRNLQEIINKAVEYIEQNTEYEEDTDIEDVNYKRQLKENVLECYFIDELLQILKG